MEESCQSEGSIEFQGRTALPSWEAKVLGGWSAIRNLSIHELRHRGPQPSSLFTQLAGADSDVAVWRLPACRRAQSQSRLVALQAFATEAIAFYFVGVPDGIRTGVIAVKGRFCLICKPLMANPQMQYRQ